VSFGWAILMAGASPGLRAVEPVSFSKQIRPILENSCWKCHGAAMQLGRLDLRTRESALKGGERGAAIVPGNSSESRIVRLIAGAEKPSMPMDGTKLTPEQISAIKDWIDQGAPWDAIDTAAQPAAVVAPIEDVPIPPEARKYWAFQKPARRPIPVNRNVDLNRHPIDAFLKDSM
jgi:hypothetical protein